MKDEDVELHAEITGLGCWYWAIGLVLIIITGFITMWLRPVWLGFERKADVASHQYVEARKNEVLTNVEKYDELTAEIAKYEKGEGNEKIVAGLKAQQKSLKAKIKAALAKIPKGERPAGTERFE